MYSEKSRAFGRGLTPSMLSLLTLVAVVSNLATKETLSIRVKLKTSMTIEAVNSWIPYFRAPC